MQAIIDLDDSALDEPTVELSAGDIARVRARIAQMEDDALSFSLDAPPLVMLDQAAAAPVQAPGREWAQGTLVAACVAGTVVLVLSMYAL